VLGMPAGEDTGGPQLRMLRLLKQKLGHDDFYLLAAQVCLCQGAPCIPTVHVHHYVQTMLPALSAHG
jgi:hypothetical protein